MQAEMRVRNLNNKNRSLLQGGGLNKQLEKEKIKIMLF